MKQDKRKTLDPGESVLNSFISINCHQCGQQFERAALTLQGSCNVEAISLLTDLPEADGSHIIQQNCACPDYCSPGT